MSSDELFSLRRQTALITGSTSGLGFEVARLFARAGAQVLINGRSESTVTKTVEIINNGGGTAFPCVFDVSDRQACSAAFDCIKEEYKSLDILVNNGEYPKLCVWGLVHAIKTGHPLNRSGYRIAN